MAIETNQPDSYKAALREKASQYLNEHLPNASSNPRENYDQGEAHIGMSLMVTLVGFLALCGISVDMNRLVEVLFNTTP